MLAVAAARALEAWAPWRDDDPRTARRTLGLGDQAAPPLEVQPERASAVLTSVLSALASARYAGPLLLACAHGGAPVESDLVPAGGRAGHHDGASERIEPAAFAVRAVEVLPVPLPCVRGIGPGAVLALLAAGVPTVAVRPSAPRTPRGELAGRRPPSSARRSRPSASHRGGW